MKLRTTLLCGVLLLGFAHEALSDSDTWILATGRRDPRMYAIDLEKALRPENNNTPNAIVSRSKVALDRLDGKLLGDSANIVISEDRKTAYVVNHHGAIENDEFNPQHGGRGNIAVMNIKKMIDRRNDNSAAALERHIDSGHFGSVGLILLKDLFVIGNAESHLTEDGGNRITFVDRKTGSLRGAVELALGPGHPQFPCPHYPVPFVSPGGPPTFPAPSAPFVRSPNGALSPVPLLSPHEAWGCFPDTNGIALARDRTGKRFVYTGNGGTNDVSVLDLDAALTGNKTAEIARIPTQSGPFGMAVSPNGRYVVAAARESQRDGSLGNTISIIDVENPTVEAARVRVGVDKDPNQGTRPFLPSFTPDGREIIVPNFAANNVSIVDLQLALARAGTLEGEVKQITVTRPLAAEPDAVARPARPKGSAVTSDGRYAVISGGPRTAPNTTPSGTVWIIDLRKRAIVATVTKVGNDPYGLAVVHVKDDGRDDD